MATDIFGLLPSVAAQERELAQQEAAQTSPAASRRGGTFVSALGQRIANRRQNERENALAGIVNEEYNTIVAEHGDKPVDVALARANSHIRTAARLQAAGNHAAAAEQYQIGAAMVQQRRAELLSNRKLEAEIGRATAQTQEADVDRMNAERLIVVDANTLAPVSRITMGPTFGREIDRMEQEHGNTVMALSPEQFADINPEAAAAIDARDLMTPSQLGDLVDVHVNAQTFTELGSRVLDIFNEGFAKNQDVFSDVSRLELTGNRARSIFREVKSRWGEQQAATDAPQTSSEVRQLGERYLERLGPNAARRSITAGLLIDMAYMFAMARNDRVTDADFDQAYNALGGDSGAAETALDTIASAIENINRAAQIKADPWMGNQAFAGSTNGQIITRASRARNEALGTYRNTFEQAMQGLGVGRHPQQAEPEAPRRRFEFVDQEVQ